MRFSILFVCLSILAAPLAAQVSTLVGPFEGSEYKGQFTAEFEQVTVLVDDGEGYAPRRIEGEERSTIIEAPEDNSQLEVVRNFELALERGGFTTLFNRPIVRSAPNNSDMVVGLRPWIRELEALNTPRAYPDEDGGTGRIQLDNIYRFPDHYLAAERQVDGVETVFALTFNAQRGLYLMEEVTRVVMSEDGVSISEAQMLSDMDAEGKAGLYGVQFDVGSAVLRPSSESSIDVIASVLRDRPGRVYVVGHTSDTGSFELNMRLSAERAQAIIDALGVDYGIDTSRLQAAGVGPVAPLASNKNEPGRQLNRRVELVERLEE